MSVALSVVRKSVDSEGGQAIEGEATGHFETGHFENESVVPLVFIADETTPEIAGETTPEITSETTPAPDRQPGNRTTPHQLDTNALRRLSDLLVLPASMLPPQDRAFAIDLMNAALVDVDAEFRSQLAGRLARMGKIAPTLIARLVRDEDIAVAGPLLRFSEAVSDRDLIAILQSGCQERALIIAGRKALSSDIVSQIAACGDDRVLLALFRNRSVCIDSFAIRRLSKRVSDCADLCEALMQRPEMGPDCALDLFWSVNRKLRMFVLNRFLQDGQVVRQILDACTNRARSQRDALNAMPCAVEAGAQSPMGKSDTQECLMTIAKLTAQANGGDAARMLAALASISAQTATSIVADTGGEAIAVAFKAAGASRATFERACELWLKTAGAPLRNDKEFEEIFEQFDRLSRGQARMAMTYWDWRENRIGPYAPDL